LIWITVLPHLDATFLITDAVVIVVVVWVVTAYLAVTVDCDDGPACCSRGTSVSYSTEITSFAALR